MNLLGPKLKKLAEFYFLELQKENPFLYFFLLLEKKLSTFLMLWLFSMVSHAVVTLKHEIIFIATLKL